MSSKISMGGCGINSAAASIKVPIWRSQSAPLISFQSLIFFAASMNCRRSSKTSASILSPLLTVQTVPTVQAVQNVLNGVQRLNFLTRFEPQLSGLFLIVFVHLALNSGLGAGLGKH